MEERGPAAQNQSITELTSAGSNSGKTDGKSLVCFETKGRPNIASRARRPVYPNIKRKPSYTETDEQSVVGAPLTPPDLRPLGLDPAKVTGVALIHRKHGNRLCRVECGERSLVFKWFSDPAQATEVRAYSLLQEIGVPTLPLHGKTENALLLEDLTASPTWRRACGADVERAEVGAAVAEWYLLLHARGGEVLTRSPESVDFLDREVDELDSRSITETGEKLGLAKNRVWRLAAESIESLKAALRSLPQTLNYNDFHWPNLALSREGAAQAVVYDYHLLGIGPRYSDCRNVAGSLGQRARAAFWEAYGPWTRGRRYSTNPFRPCSPYKQRRGVRDSRAGRENAFRWCRAANWRGASEGP